jgi:hypothetical protein
MKIICFQEVMIYQKTFQDTDYFQHDDWQQLHKPSMIVSFSN